MYLGKFCEVGPGESVYQQPLHPYTKALLDSIPLDRAGRGAGHRDRCSGEPPSPVNPPSGCRFRTRCPRAADRCAARRRSHGSSAPGHLVACHFPLTEPAPAVPAQTAAPTVPSTAQAQG